MAKRVTVIKLTWHGDGLLDLVKHNKEDALLEAAEMLRDAAVAKAPKRSGKLRESAYVRTSKSSTYTKRPGHRKEAPIDEGMALVGFAAFYALMVEKGTRYAAARPYIRPAFDELKVRMGQKVADELGKSLELGSKRMTK